MAPFRAFQIYGSWIQSKLADEEFSLLSILKGELDRLRGEPEGTDMIVDRSGTVHPENSLMMGIRKGIRLMEAN